MIVLDEDGTFRTFIPTHYDQFSSSILVYDKPKWKLFAVLNCGWGRFSYIVMRSYLGYEVSLKLYLSSDELLKLLPLDGPLVKAMLSKLFPNKPRSKRYNPRRQTIIRNERRFWEEYWKNGEWKC